MAYRILSLDGGGTWALIQVKGLIALYNNDPGTPGRAVLADFDMVAANSGGSIVLGTLLENFTLGDTLAFFENEAVRKSVFSKTDSIGDRVLRDLSGLGPKYSAKNKLPALQDVLRKRGNVPLHQVAAGLRRVSSSSDLHLLIVSFDYDRNRAAFLRSAPASGPNWGQGESSDVTLAEAIHASTNAPVNYFDAPACFPDRPARYWDGAITGCNNPVLAGVAEAIALKQEPTDIVALSIGTASVALPWPQPGEPDSPFLQHPADSGLIPDLHKLATAILDDPPDVATYLAHLMTGSGAGLADRDLHSRIVRLNPLISPMGKAGAWTSPGNMTVEQFLYLAKLDMDAVEQPQVDAISQYADLWVQDSVRNQPIRMNGDTLAVELGQTTFTAAKNAWNSIR